MSKEKKPLEVNPKPRKLTPDEVREAYCENESTYGYGCQVPSCPHCAGDRWHVMHPNHGKETT